MHALDVIIAIIAAVFIFQGIKRGLIGEVIRLAAMIVGCLVAFLYYHDIGSMAPIRNIPTQPQIKNGLAFILIYVACALAILGAGWFIKKAVHLTPLGLVDRIAGGCIGFLKILIIAYVACLSISSMPVRRIRKELGRSIVYRSYSALPHSFSLTSLLKKRREFRNIFNRKPAKKLEKVQHEFNRFKASVDSAKEANSPGK
jgi:uncharacterized membrane protein required for colicin V production